MILQRFNRSISRSRLRTAKADGGWASSRTLLVETLESRRLLTAEAETFAFNESMNASGFLGSTSAEVSWGDGTTSTATVTPTNNATGSLKVTFKYDLDSSNFFASQDRKNLLQDAADSIAKMFTDTLAAITVPNTNFSWTPTYIDPLTGGSVDLTAFKDLAIGQNEIVIFADARNLGGGTAYGGPGGYNATYPSGDESFVNLVKGRGQTGALLDTPSDVGLWGGYIVFDNTSTTDWYFDEDISAIASNQVDFLSVAMHELAHVFGFGTSASWNQFVNTSNSTFNGPKAKAVAGTPGGVPLNGPQHWAASTDPDDGSDLLEPTIFAGRRVYLSELDFAAMDDIGWDLVDRSVNVSASHPYADDGVYAVDVTLKGSELGQSTLSLSSTVTNVAPTLTLAAPSSVIVGQTLQVTNLGEISDPGYANPANPDGATVETFDYSINWGDGSTATTGTATIDQIGNATRSTLASFDGSHVYSTVGNKTVTVTVTDDDGGTDTKTYVVNVLPQPVLQLALSRTTIKEDDDVGAATLTITRDSGSVGQALVVTLNSSDTTELSVQNTVTFDPNSATADVPLNAVDDNLLDGSQSVSVEASAVGYESAQAEVTVDDVESLIGSFSMPHLMENASAGTLTLTVQRTNTDNSAPVTVTVVGNATSDVVGNPLVFDSSVTIAANQQQAVMSLELEDDDLYQGPREWAFTLSNALYPDALASVVILDDEPAKFRNNSLSCDVNQKDQCTPLDALLIINAISAGMDQLDPNDEVPEYGLVDVNGDYRVSPIDALYVLNELAMAAGSLGQPVAQSEGESEEEDNLWASYDPWGYLFSIL